MRTKIVATLGPATDEHDRVHALADLGVDVIRINFAHGSHETAGRWIRWVREASDAIGRPLAILADLAGPKIRIGALDRPVELVDRTEVVLAPEATAGPGEIPTTWPALADDVVPGGRILLADGIMELRVRHVEPPRIFCEVVRGGVLHAHKGMNLPGIEINTPALTAKDRADLAFALEQEVDYIGLSFVQRAQDVLDLRALIPGGTLIVAKIEKDRALAQIESILAASDAVMVARGDLGVELPFEQVPIAQKRIVQFANLHARPVITATQMLESMMENPRPTRAEASDVANALFDGTDAVMLSGETAAGKYPLLAVDAMVRIASEIERSQAYGEGPKYDVPTTRHLRAGATPTEHAIAAAVVEAARMLGAPAIVTLTRSGTTSRLVSSYRPNIPILGVTYERRTWRQLALVWGLHPVHCTGTVSYDAMLDAARAYLVRNHLAVPGQRVVVTAGVPFDVQGTTNMVRVEEL